MASEVHEVLTYALKTYVSPEMLEQQKEYVEGSLKATVEAQAEKAGLVILPDTTEVQFYEPNYKLPEDPEWLDGYWLARASVRCYRPEETA